MPDMQSPMTSTAAVPPGVEVCMPASLDDMEYAFGCECADPALQIESWAPQARATGEPN
jgi:hypothetical protein